MHLKSGRKIAVLGLGYVGFPVACSFSKLDETICFDVDSERVAQLKKGYDKTKEVAEDEICNKNLIFTDDPRDLRKADFFIVAVPTPIDSARRPNLDALVSVSSMLGGILKEGDIVVYESTVYPGVTEEECIPILEKYSGLVSGKQFHVGYSPERINPGDKKHRFETIMKVVSAQSDEATEIIAATYASVVRAGVFKARSIKVAEAAKVIENTQRDVNIALMNELAKIFDLMEIDTRDVLDAAGTKWNFLKFEPGLVGGHCIGVDPYYLTHKSQQLGYDPMVILSGRSLNDGMGGYIAERAVKALVELGEEVKGSLVTVLGLTFKENVPDLRNSLVFDIINDLSKHDIEVQLCDPVIEPEDLLKQYRLKLKTLNELSPAKVVIYAVPHDEFRESGWKGLVENSLIDGSGIVVDVKAALPKEGIPEGVGIWRL